MTVLYANMTYKRVYSPWLSLIKVGHIQYLNHHDCPLYKYDIYKTLLTMTVLHTSRTYRKPYLYKGHAWSIRSFYFLLVLRTLMVNKVFYMSYLYEGQSWSIRFCICHTCTKDSHGQLDIVYVLLLKYLIDHDSFIQVGHTKTLFTKTVLYTNMTYKRLYCPWLSLIQVGHIKDLINHDCKIFLYPTCIKDSHGQ
jgi:hypothetical protein